VVLEDTAAALAKKTDKLAKSRAKLSEPLPADAGTREVIDAHIFDAHISMYLDKIFF
jgi:hypothetical protein